MSWRWREIRGRYRGRWPSRWGPGAAGVPSAATLARVLARQQLLLVLDNCEQAIGAAAELGAELLAACDDLRILATSREALRVVGEARYRLGPAGGSRCR